MCVVYNDYMAKRMDKHKENVALVSCGGCVKNVFKNMNNCNFFTLIVSVDFSMETITKVLEFFKG